MTPTAKMITAFIVGVVVGSYGVQHVLHGLGQFLSSFHG